MPATAVPPSVNGTVVATPNAAGKLADVVDDELARELADLARLRRDALPRPPRVGGGEQIDDAVEERHDAVRLHARRLAGPRTPRRLAYLETHKITRPADWLTRETDAAVGVPHSWLAHPLVEQGSMNGRFASSLDQKRAVPAK